MVQNTNILIISIDSLRADHCSFLGAERTTPNMNAFANRSTNFTNAISPSTWTLPVHMSVFTGLYPLEHQVLDSSVELGPHPTLGEHLSEVGYDTLSFGRNSWLEQGGMLRGFNHTVTTRPMADWDGWKGRMRLYHRWLRRLLFRHQSNDELTIRNAIDCINAQNGPYCCFVHLNSAHYIYNPPSPYHRYFTNYSTPNLMYNLFEQKKLFIKYGGIYPGRQKPTDSFVTKVKELYQGSVRYVDELIKKLLNSVESKDRDTIIIIFGDHGDNFGQDGIFGHQYSLDDAVIRVPLLIHDPTQKLPKERISDIVQLNDIYSTLLSIIGEPVPETSSIDLTDQRGREMALVHTKPPQTHSEKVQRHTSASKLPPETQIMGWLSPNEKFMWYPEIDEHISQTENKAANKLRKKLESLTPVETIQSRGLSDKAEANLERLGYI